MSIDSISTIVVWWLALELLWQTNVYECDDKIEVTFYMAINAKAKNKWFFGGNLVFIINYGMQKKY